MAMEIKITKTDDCQIEKPDAILHYTDPRFWGWLYQMEHEVRQQCPIFYYNIWDDLPYPRWNEPFYESCDLIMNISKQTHNIVKMFVKRTKPKNRLGFNLCSTRNK